MKAPPFTALALCTAIACTALTCSGARAETATDAEALRSSLADMLSLLSFGSVSVADRPEELTQSGNDVRIRLPLNGFVAPAGASVEAVAHSAADGAWDLTSMT